MYAQPNLFVSKIFGIKLFVLKKHDNKEETTVAIFYLVNFVFTSKITILRNFILVQKIKQMPYVELTDV